MPHVPVEKTGTWALNGGAGVTQTVARKPHECLIQARMASSVVLKVVRSRVQTALLVGADRWRFPLRSQCPAKLAQHLALDPPCAALVAAARLRPQHALGVHLRESTIPSGRSTTAYVPPALTLYRQPLCKTRSGSGPSAGREPGSASALRRQCSYASPRPRSHLFSVGPKGRGGPIHLGFIARHCE